MEIELLQRNGRNSTVCRWQYSPFCLIAAVLLATVLITTTIAAANFKPVQLTSGMAYDGNPHWSADGRLVVFTSDRSGYYNIWVMSADGSDLVQVTTGNGSDYAPTFSPGGNSIAFFRYSDGNADLYTVPAVGGSPTRLTSDPASDAAPVWSPDGSQIAFHSDRGGNFDIWTIPSGGGTPVPLTSDPADDFAPSWSPNGTTVAFSSNRSGRRDIWLIPTSGGTASPLTFDPADEDEPRWSPDGATIAFNYGPHGSRDIWTIPATGGISAQITTDPADDGTATWYPDGTRIAFHSDRAGQYDIWMLPIHQFTERNLTDAPGEPITTLAVAWTDVDNDTDQDIFVTNMGTGGDSQNRLYLNNGSGQFEELAGDPLVDDMEDSRGACWGDFDNDGHVDVYLTNFGWSTNSFYTNDGDGEHFTKATEGDHVSDAWSSFNAGWADYDNDGDLDLYVVNENELVPPPGPAVNQLYRNDGGSFTGVTTGDAVTDAHASQALAWCDYDNDGDMDLFVTNSSGENNNLYQNDGAGNLTSVTDLIIATDGGASFSPSFADFDNDGDQDLFVTTGWGSPHGLNCFYANNGDGTFDKIATGVLVEDSTMSFSSAPADFDNDGDLDLFVSDRPYNRLYENMGGLQFDRYHGSPVVSDSGRWYAGAWGDCDSDGDLDLFVTEPGNGPGRLYLNNGSANHWITFRLTGTVSNRSAIGAKVRVLATINAESVWQLREITTNSGAWSQNSLEPHFGLGDAGIVDSIVIEWPSGIVQAMTDVGVDLFLDVTESCCGRYTEGLTGNTNCDEEGLLSLSDITRLIDRVYISKDPLCCEENGNVNGSLDGLITLSDITRLIDAVYVSKGPTELCL